MAGNGVQAVAALGLEGREEQAGVVSTALMFVRMSQ